MSDTLAAKIERGAILANLEASDSEAVIRRLAGALEALGYVRPSYVEAVLKREAQMPTGLPMGGDSNVAVPHTDPEHVLRAGIALATLARPVEFANMEDPDEAVPVRIVFMLAIDDKDRQIDTLQQVLMTIQDEALVERMLASKTAEDLHRLLADAAQQGE